MGSIADDEAISGDELNEEITIRKTPTATKVNLEILNIDISDFRSKSTLQMEVGH